MTTEVKLINKGPKNVRVYVGTLEVGTTHTVKPHEEISVYLHSSAQVEISEEYEVT